MGVQHKEFMFNAKHDRIKKRFFRGQVKHESIKNNEGRDLIFGGNSVQLVDHESIRRV